MRRAWELLYLLTKRELKLRYQDTVFGFLWSMVKPLLLAAVLFVALKKIAKLDLPDYSLVLITGLFPWTWFQTSLVMATPSFAGNGPLIKKVYFPRYVLPFATIANNGVHFVLSLPIILIFVLISGRTPDWTWLIGIPLLFVVELGFLFGALLLVASLDVFFRDLEHLVDVGSLLLFYLTPILYPLSKVTGRYRPLILANPMTGIIEAWRQLFMDNTIPGAEVLPGVIFAVAALALGTLAFRQMQGNFADAL